MRTLVGWQRGLFSGVILSGAVSASVSARADTILVYQKNDTTAAESAGAMLDDLGHDVTVVAGTEADTLPSLDGYDSVWFVTKVPLTSQSEQDAVKAYLNAGGALYVSGESDTNTGWRGNELTGALLSPLYRTGRRPYMAPIPAMHAEHYDAVPDAPFGLTQTPNVLEGWEADDGGWLDIDPYDPHAAFIDEDGHVGVGVYGGEDLIAGGGCLVVAMDVDFWVGAPDPAFVENIQHFLSTCADSDGDGLSDEYEEEAGTDSEDPDGDDDGVCDGHGHVEGVCLSGEHPEDDFDEDGEPSPFDTDDDNDSIPTRFESDVEAEYPDVDSDLGPAWSDVDSDGDSSDDKFEGMGDYDDDGIPAIVDPDDFPTPCGTDGDCVDVPNGHFCDLIVSPDYGYCHPGPGSSGSGGSGGGGGSGGKGGSGSSGKGGSSSQADGGEADTGVSGDTGEGGSDASSSGGKGGSLTSGEAGNDNTGGDAPSAGGKGGSAGSAGKAAAGGKKGNAADDDADDEGCNLGHGRPAASAWLAGLAWLGLALVRRRRSNARATASVR
jgi:hypothetical protein